MAKHNNLFHCSANSAHHLPNKTAIVRDGSSLFSLPSVRILLIHVITAVAEMQLGQHQCFSLGSCTTLILY